MEIQRDKFYSMTTKERIVLSQELYRFLAPIMNEIHEVNYSERFWTLLLAKYVTTINTRRAEFTNSLITLRPRIEPLNSFVPPTFKQRFIVALKYNVKAFKSRAQEKIIDQQLSQNNQIAFGFHDVPSIKDDVPTYLDTFYPLRYGRIKNKNLRSKLNKIALRYTSIFERNVVRQLPISYVELFAKNMDRIKLYAPEEKTFHLSMIESDYMRFMLAKYSENGSKIHYYQHGAFYGEYKYYSPYEWEYLICDKYFTWGWKINEKDTPWKAYRLNRFARNYAKFKGDKRYDCMVVFPQITAHSLAEFQTKTGKLIESLDQTKYKSILIRPRPSATDLKYDEQFKFITDPRAKIDDGKSVIGELISESKLIIQYNYPSTNFLECLYVDAPSVVILTNKEPTDVAKPFYEFFLEVGVFHYDFESLVQHLNKIEVDKWWAELKKHPKYIEFKNTFIRQN